MEGKKTIPIVPALIIGLFTLVGMVGFLMPHIAPRMAALTPLHLMVVTLCLMASTRPFTFYLPWRRLALVGSLGFVIEVIGTHTGYPFGPYTYDFNLGLRLASTPIIIGLNWALLLYINTHVFARFQFPAWMHHLLVALGMTFLDALIEPFAIRYELWHWDNLAGNVPLSNYIAWFTISLVLSRYIFPTPAKNQWHPLAVFAWVSLAVFFIVVNMFGV